MIDNTGKTVRSLGAKSFVRAIGGCGQSEAARRMGVTQAAVSKWCSGECLPNAERRALIAKTFGVEESEWDQFIVPQEKSAKLVVGQTRRSVREDVPMVQALALTLLKEVAEDHLATPAEKAANLLKISQVLLHVGKITGETSTITEGVIIKLPPFRSLTKKLFVALAPWPDAVKAVMDRLAEIEAEG